MKYSTSVKLLQPCWHQRFSQGKFCRDSSEIESDHWNFTQTVLESMPAIPGISSPYLSYFMGRNGWLYQLNRSRPAQGHAQVLRAVIDGIEAGISRLLSFIHLTKSCCLCASSTMMVMTCGNLWENTAYCPPHHHYRRSSVKPYARRIKCNT